MAGWATSFTSPSEDIAYQEGTFAMFFTASGNISKGQGVYPIDDKYVAAPGTSQSGQNGIGVTQYGASHGEKLAVFVPGNMVRTQVSGSAGDTVGLSTVGILRLHADNDHSADVDCPAPTGRVCGVVIDGAADDTGIVYLV